MYNHIKSKGDANIIEDFDIMKIQVKQANHKSGFVIKSSEPKDYEDFGEEVRVEDYDEFRN